MSESFKVSSEASPVSPEERFFEPDSDPQRAEQIAEAKRQAPQEAREIIERIEGEAQTSLERADELDVIIDDLTDRGKYPDINLNQPLVRLLCAQATMYRRTHEAELAGQDATAAAEIYDQTAAEMLNS